MDRAFIVPKRTEDRAQFFRTVDPVTFVAHRVEKYARLEARGKPVKSDVYRGAIQAMVATSGAKRVVEVGVFDGRLSRLLASLPGVELTIVDPWAAYKYYPQKLMDAVADSVMAWAETMTNVNVMRLPSLEAVHLFDDESIDFFETDGDHSYEQVRDEVAAWLPKIRPGGFITGDNYDGDPVARGVKHTLPNCPSMAKGRIWWHQIPV